jgi:diguanylate cyclase (GGDEF)-like protein
MKEGTRRLLAWATREHPVLAACVLTALIAPLDYTTGTELRLYPLYFIPLALVARAGTRLQSAAAAAGLSSVWAVSNYRPDVTNVFCINVLSQLIAFFVVAVLVNGLKEQAEKQRLLASTDALTGLLNARAFFQASTRELAVQRRRQTSLTMAYLDVDDFKKVNSTLGHLGADDLLRDMARVMKESLRGTDLIGRVGGDEFAIILPDTGKEPARGVLARLQKAVFHATRRSEMAVTVSVGAVVFDAPAESVNHMMEMSDQLMYSVKGATKDDVAIRLASDFSGVAGS